MRLDKFLSVTGKASRSEASKAAKAGRLTVNGRAVRDCSCHIDPESDEICFDGLRIVYREFTWIMMNKPAGVLSVSEDKKQKTVVDLLPEPLCRMGLFPCGRLDKDTVGLLMLTNDGALSHDLLSPKHHAEKQYFFRLDKPYDTSSGIERGIMMDGKLTKPAKIEMQDALSGVITLTEGKYHQIKRMFAYAGSTVIYLKRISFAGIELDASLAEGKWRYLSPEEETLLREAGTAHKGQIF